MIGYYSVLALRSLRRTPVLTALMILAIGVGIGTSMTTLAMFRAAAGDPIPSKSAELFTPQIDNCGSKCALLRFGSYSPPDRMPLLLSYRDAAALTHLPSHDTQEAMYATDVTVVPPDPRSHPLQAVVRATGAGFFSMFQVPFQYGAPWSRHEDDAHAPVVVITRALNDRLFDGADSVGKTLRLDTNDYRIEGVIDTWQAVPQFYDLFSNLGEADSLFIPFTRAVDMQLEPAYVTCSGAGPTQPGKDAWHGLIDSECNWVDFWVQLSDDAALHRYRQMLTAYVNDQRRDGRFLWPPRVQLRDVMQWLRYLDVVPAEVRVAVIVSLGLLGACLVNAMGLILARFLPRMLDISVRRAAGATRPAIFLQSLIELGMIGLFGAGLGLLLTALGLQVSRKLLPLNLLALVRFDSADIGIAFALSIAAALIAGLYPIWRVSRVQPALHLKVQ